MLPENYYIKTPVYRSHYLKNKLGKNVYYKMECFQPTNSFKIRGMETLCKFHFSNGKKNFVSSSGGNAGYSLAFVGQKTGVNVRVFVPETTSRFMIDKITNLGAEVEIHGKVWDEADQYALKESRETNAVYVSPFDDPLLWKGHSSIVDECADQMEEPDTIIVSVGGGGLLCGILEGLKSNGWDKTKIITAETEGAASFYESFHAKKIVELDTISTIATSLAAKKVTTELLDLIHDFSIVPFTMDDKDAISALLRFLDEYSVLVEPACGASLSIPYFYPEMIKDDKNILVIACGGAGSQIKNYL